MARIWQEGFEAGLLDVQYMEGLRPTQIKDFDTSSSANDDIDQYAFPDYIGLATGRNSYSLKSLLVKGNSSFAIRATKVLATSQSEIYFRAYVKVKINEADNGNEVLALVDTSDNYVMSLYSNLASGSYDLKVKTGGSYQSVVTGITLVSEQWYKIDFYFKVGNGIGAYEFKIDDVSQDSGSSDNTGTNNVKLIAFGHGTAGCEDEYYFDDLALNDTTGTINNSWCGAGTIIGLKPNGAGNYSQWDSCKGYAVAESGTGTTTIKITGHGLSTNDIIYNKTRNAYRVVTVSDVDTLTVSSITSQAQDDVILMYSYQAQINNTIGTTSGDDRYCTIVGHNLESGDVFMNVDTGNTIRRVLYVNGDDVYCASVFTSTIHGVLGSNISTMNAGDVIKTFKFHPYAITNHYSAVGNNSTDDKSSKYSYIQSNTTNDIDSFDMEELVNDKSVSANVQINAVSLHAYAKEAGAGSQFQHLLRISSTDYVGDTKTMSGGTLDYQHVWNVSPNSSARFTQSEIDALEAGVKVVS